MGRFSRIKDKFVKKENDINDHPIDEYIDNYWLLNIPKNESIKGNNYKVYQLIKKIIKSEWNVEDGGPVEKQIKRNRQETSPKMIGMQSKRSVFLDPMAKYTRK